MIIKKNKTYVDFYNQQINKILDNPDSFIILEKLFNYSSKHIEVFEQELLMYPEQELVLGFNARDKVITVNQLNNDTVAFKIFPAKKDKKINKYFASLIKGEVLLSDIKEEIIILFKKEFNKFYQKLYELELSPDFERLLLRNERHQYFQEEFSVLHWIQAYQKINHNSSNSYDFYLIFTQHITTIERLEAVISNLSIKQLVIFYKVFLNNFRQKTEFLNQCQKIFQQSILNQLDTYLVQDSYNKIAYLLYTIYQTEKIDVLGDNLIHLINEHLSKKQLVFCLKSSSAEPSTNYYTYVNKIESFPSYLDSYFVLINKDVYLYVKEINYKQLMNQIKSYQLLNKLSNSLNIHVTPIISESYHIIESSNIYVLLRKI